MSFIIVPVGTRLVFDNTGERPAIFSMGVENEYGVEPSVVGFVIELDNDTGDLVLSERERGEWLNDSIEALLDG